jgi:phosphatidylglycerol lysyltransferase
MLSQSALGRKGKPYTVIGAESVTRGGGEHFAAPVVASAVTDRHRPLRWLWPAIVLLLVAGAIYILHGELREYRYHDIMRELAAVPAARLGLAAFWTAVAYAILPGYDAVALAYVGRRLPLPWIAFSSFTSYALSHTLGFSLVTGGSVRYRFWSAWGLSPAEIAQAVSFVGATFTLGIVTVSGVALLLEPAGMTASIGLPVPLMRPLGVALLAAVAAWLVWSAARREPLRVFGFEFPVPSARLAGAQIVIAAADWAAATAVLYVLLPWERAPGGAPGFTAFLGIFLLAQFAGLLSHVPGGVGVFETLVVLLLRPFLPASAVVGALLAYRAIYYLAPFTLGIAMLVGHEAHRQRERVALVAGVAGRWIPAALPTVLSTTTFLGGAILLFSGATPSVRGRVSALDALLPLGVIELSHFLGSLAGAGLLVLAWALRRRLDAAWGATVVLLGVGIVASLFKGLDWEEALALSAVLALLVPSRKAFYRKAALTSEPFSPEWIVAMAIVIGVTLWLGAFSFKHVEYSTELWWRFRTHGDAPRFLRATVGVLGALVVFALMRLMRHAPGEPTPPTVAELEKAGRVVAAQPHTDASLALLGDKSLLFSDDDSAFLMYGVEKRSWVALGDPIGAPERWDELAWRFREMADEHGGWTVFYQASPDALPIYIDLGLTLLKLGEEARVPLAAFSLDGGNRKGMRRTVKEVERTGAAFEIVPAAGAAALMPELRRVSDAWLEEKRTREKSFSLGRFDESYLAHFPLGLIRREAGGPIVAFANIWRTDSREELSVDLMRHTPDAPRGVMEYLFIQMLLWGQHEGYGWFSLGMAPLSGLEPHPLGPRWTRLASLLFRHGEHFYNFRGLRQYKEKFDPVWAPRYLASPGGLVLPRVLTNVAALISGGLRGVVAR